MTRREARRHPRHRVCLSLSDPRYFCNSVLLYDTGGRDKCYHNTVGVGPPAQLWTRYYGALKGSYYSRDRVNFPITKRRSSKLNNRKAENRTAVTTGGCMIKRSLKYVLINDKMNFSNHFVCALQSVSTTIMTLSEMMSNSSVMCSSKRRLLATIAMSILKIPL